MVAPSTRWGYRTGAVARARNGRLYQVLMLATDSFRLRWQRLDTLAELGPGYPTQLRRYRGKYYLSTPADSGRWVVERLAVAGSWLSWQEFNPDSLRIRALYQETVRLQRANRRLFFILNPRLGRATHQVDSYAGLWLLKGGYGRKK